MFRTMQARRLAIELIQARKLEVDFGVNDDPIRPREIHILVGADGTVLDTVSGITYTYQVVQHHRSGTRVSDRIVFTELNGWSMYETAIALNNVLPT